MTMNKHEKSPLEKLIAIETALETMSRPTILPKPLPMYEHEYSEIPERIRVKFSNGRTAVYELRVDQPAPVIVENIKIIRKWKQGYVNKPERRKRK